MAKRDRAAGDGAAGDRAAGDRAAEDGAAGNRAVVVAGERRQAVRHRHDGWTPERQASFLERLAETGCVGEACRAVGLSSTSGYRAYARMPDFAAAWDQALAVRRPMLEEAAFERATRGVAVPITRQGKVVGQRQRFSDGLLRYLIERGDKREAADARTVADARLIEARPLPPGTPSQAEVDAMLLTRLDEAARCQRGERPPASAEEEARVKAWIESLKPHGYVPPEGWDGGAE